LKNLFRSPLFLAGLAIRVLLLPLQGSHYLRDLFIPFLDSAVLHPLSNPWSLLPPQHFPYGSVLFATLALPRLLAHAVLGDLALGAGPVGTMLVKLPLLGLDLALLVTLGRLAGDRARQMLIYYWLSPIAIYITYVHGQLDVAVMAFCLISLELLVRRRIALSGLAMAAATLCKFHVVVIVPFAIVYLWNSQFAGRAIREIANWAGIWLVCSVIGFLPLALSNHFLYASTSSPEAFRVFAAQMDFGSGQVLYLGVVGVLAVLGRLCVSTRITERGLIFGAGALFGTLLLVTATMPGWYFWIVPFAALLMAIYLNVPRTLFWLFGALHLLYFGVIQAFPESFSPLVNGVAFTLLQTTLGGMIVTMWALVVRKEAVLLGRATPVRLGLAGDSGAGKNTISTILTDLFTPRSTTVIEGDDYHKWERFHERWNDYTHLNPKANYLAEMAFHADQLTRGQPIQQAHYDHSSGLFTEPREMRPSRTVIIQGLHTFYLRTMRRSLDLKIFLAPDRLVRLAWKLKRDVNERGHSVERVLDSISKRQADSDTHIAPQKQFADWIIEYVPGGPVTEQEILAGKQPDINLRFTVWNDAPVGNLMAALNEIPGCKAQFDVQPGEIDRVVLQVAGKPTREAVTEVAARIFPNIRQITRGWGPPKWHDGTNGIVQLMALALLSDRLSQSGPREMN
jgi:uridine kinase